MALKKSESEIQTEPDATVWLNAFACVRPTDKFAQDVGHDVIQQLKTAGQLPGEILIKIRAS